MAPAADLRIECHAAQNHIDRGRCDTRGFMKSLIDNTSDRLIGFSMFGAEVGEVMASVQVAMIAGLPFTALRDAIFVHPTMAEGLIPLFSNVPTAHAIVRTQPAHQTA